MPTAAGVSMLRCRDSRGLAAPGLTLGPLHRTWEGRGDGERSHWPHASREGPVLLGASAACPQHGFALPQGSVTLGSIPSPGVTRPVLLQPRDSRYPASTTHSPWKLPARSRPLSQTSIFFHSSGWRVLRPLPEASQEWLLPRHTAKEGQLAGLPRCASVPTAGATFAGVPQGCGWSGAHPAKDSKGPELLANGPCSGQERGSHKPICFLGSHFRGFSITGRVESGFGFLVPFKRRVPVLPQGRGWGKLPSQAFLGHPTRAVPCQGTGGAGLTNQPACSIPGSKSPSLGNTRLSRPPDSFAGTGVYPDPACVCGFALSALVSVLRGAGPVPCCCGERGQLLPGVPVQAGGWSRAGHRGPVGSICAGVGGFDAAREGPGSGRWAGLVWWPSLGVFQTMISARWHPSALATGRIGFPTGTAGAAHVPGLALLRLSRMRERHPPRPGCFVGGGADWDTSAPKQTPFWRAGPAAQGRTSPGRSSEG